MKNKIILVIVLILIGGAIFLLESQKAGPNILGGDSNNSSESEIEMLDDIVIANQEEEKKQNMIQGDDATNSGDNNGDSGGVNFNGGNGGEDNGDMIKEVSEPKNIKTTEERIAEKSTKYQRAIEISSPDGFINTEGNQINIADNLGKKVVLVDFWTYSCINCQRTQPYLNAWHKEYEDDGLLIIGIHTPEFDFEKEYQNVLDASEKFNIEYPIVLDNDYSTWQAYKNRYWPRKYLIDIDGFIVYDHIGEGAYGETENKIRELLKERAEVLDRNIVFNSNLVSWSVSGEQSQATTPEIYFGSSRNELLANGQVGKIGDQSFVKPNVSSLQQNKLYLYGNWNIKSEYATNVGMKGGSDGQNGDGQNGQSEQFGQGEQDGIFLNFNAKNVYMVAESVGEVSKVDVYIDGNFSKTISIESSRLYDVYGGQSVGNHVLEIRAKEGQVNFYTFTFG